MRRDPFQQADERGPIRLVQGREQFRLAGGPRLGERGHQRVVVPMRGVRGVQRLDGEPEIDHARIRANIVASFCQGADPLPVAVRGGVSLGKAVRTARRVTRRSKYAFVVPTTAAGSPRAWLNP